MENIYTEDISNKLNQFANQLNDNQFVPMDDDGATKLVELLKAESLGKKLKADLKEITNPTRQEVKALVDLFYQTQQQRIATRAMIRAVEDDTTGSTKNNVLVLDWAMKNAAVTEKGIAQALEIICGNTAVGRWMLSITGMGPVLTAGCLAYFDVTDKQYASQFISYAGLNDNNRPWIGRKGAEAIMAELAPKGVELTDDIVIEFSNRTQWKMPYLTAKAYDQEKQKWNKTELIKAAAKIPYNKDLKVLCYKIGDSFKWQRNNTKSLYGRLFTERKAHEMELNAQFAFRDQAEKKLATTNIGKGTVAYSCYSKGQLPAAHIEARAARYATKIFISHLFEEMYRVANDKVPPRYYALEHLDGHHDEIAPEVPYTPVSSEKQG